MISIQKRCGGEKLFYSISLFSAFSVLFILFGAWIILLFESHTAINQIGFFNFLTSSNWDPANSDFGALIPIVGTLITTTLALVMAVPLSIGIAIFTVEISPSPLKAVLTTIIELLAALPSIVFGLWGLYRLAPIMGTGIEPILQNIFYPFPFIGKLFSGIPLGIDILTASIILAIMIIPFISSITRSAFERTPNVIKESAYALGATKWEVIRYIVIPSSKYSIYSATFVALGKALGETMAVVFLLGNRHQFAESFFDATSTITVTLVNEFTTTSSELYYSSLVFLALILFSISITTLAVSKLILRRDQ